MTKDKHISTIEAINLVEREIEERLEEAVRSTMRTATEEAPLELPVARHVDFIIDVAPPSSR